MRDFYQKATGHVASAALVKGTTVTATIHDAAHNPVAGAIVSDNWSGGFSAAASCATDAQGLCSVTTGKIQNRRTSVTFTVTNVTGSNMAYEPSASHDPDGSSNGTSITLNKP